MRRSDCAVISKAERENKLYPVDAVRQPKKRAGQDIIVLFVEGSAGAAQQRDSDSGCGADDQGVSPAAPPCNGNSIIAAPSGFKIGQSGQRSNRHMALRSSIRLFDVT